MTYTLLSLKSRFILLDRFDEFKVPLSMKTVTISQFKSNLSEYAAKVQQGAEFIVTHGRKRKKIFKVIPIVEEKPSKRKLGVLKGKATVVFHDDWKMTTKEFTGL